MKPQYHDEDSRLNIKFHRNEICRSQEYEKKSLFIWAQAIQEVYRCQPTSLASLKSLAGEFAANIDEENVRKIVHNVKKRAAICRD